MRISKPVLHPEEIKAKLEAESASPAAITAALNAKLEAEARAQGDYEKNPPAVAYTRAVRE